MILERTQMLAEKVPGEDWRFFRKPCEFFRENDYRLDPTDFISRQRSSPVTEVRYS
jgi:hypothetical protein